MSSPRNTRSVMDFDSLSELQHALQTLSCTGSSRNFAQNEQHSNGLPFRQPLDLDKEAARLWALREFQILDTPKEEAFEKICSRVMQEYSVPWASIGLVDLGRVWFKTMVEDDLNIKEKARDESFCAHILHQKEDSVMVIPDTLQDARFASNSYVVKGPGFRFYAGVPLVSPDGHVLGSFSILDKKPHPHGLTEQEEQQLKRVSELVVKLLVQRRDMIQAQSQRKRSVGEAKTSSLPPKSASRQASNVIDLLSDCDSYSFSSSSSSMHSPAVHKKSKVIQDGRLSPLSDEEHDDMETIRKPPLNVILPDPTTAGVDPDEFLLQLVQGIHGLKLKVRQGRDLHAFFPKITEAQMSAYSIDVVSAARENKVDNLRAIFHERGRPALDCFNRFGEGLLNLSCRRGFKESVSFLLSPEVALDVRVRDDYGRTPLHDACWNAEPQLEICTWIMNLDPSLFLIADNRGYTPFQYARKSDWHIWRKFLFERRDLLVGLTKKDVLQFFSAEN